MAPEIHAALPARRRPARRRAGGARQRAAAHAARPTPAGATAAGDDVAGHPDAAEGARNAAAALLLALPQAAPRALGSLPVLRRSAVTMPVAIEVRVESPAQVHSESQCQRSSIDGVSGHGQDLDERQAGRVEGRDDPHRVARHPLRQRRVRRRALLRDAEGLGLLPPRRAHAPPAALRQDLPDGVPARPRRLAATPCSRRSAPTR